VKNGPGRSLFSLARAVRVPGGPSRNSSNSGSPSSWRYEGMLRPGIRFAWARGQENPPVPPLPECRDIAPMRGIPRLVGGRCGPSRFPTLWRTPTRRKHEAPPVRKAARGNGSLSADKSEGELPTSLRSDRVGAGRGSEQGADRSLPPWGRAQVRSFTDRPCRASPHRGPTRPDSPSASTSAS
jgi:hypothetical protein